MCVTDIKYDQVISNDSLSYYFKMQEKKEERKEESKKDSLWHALLETWASHSTK